VLRNVAAIFVDEESRNNEQDNDNSTQVLFVTNQNAKGLRTALEAEGLLDKTYRMVKADGKSQELHDPDGHIAIPIKGEGLACLATRPVWAQLVVATGRQDMPLSTAVMGAKKQNGK
jgi:hypothetical protein